MALRNSRGSRPSNLRKSQAREPGDDQSPPWGEEPVKETWHLWEYDPAKDQTVYQGTVDRNLGDDEVSRYLTPAQHGKIMDDPGTWVELAGE